MAKSLQLRPTLAVLWTVARQAPLSVGFSRQEDWSGLPFPTPEDLPDPGIEPTSLVSPALAGGFFTTMPPGNLSNFTTLPQDSKSLKGSSDVKNKDHQSTP